MNRIVSLAVLALLVAGCGHEQRSTIPADPPSPANWPPYLSFSQRSCWPGPYPDPESMMRAAPSFVAPRPQPPSPARMLVRRLLARFGDPRYVLRVELGPRPPLTRQHLGWFPVRPPEDGLWAYLAAPGAVVRDISRQASVQELGEQMRAEWEVNLVWGALRDDFCAAGRRPLIGWSVSPDVRGPSSSAYPFGQRFPNPPPRVFRRRLALVADVFGFKVVSLRLLRPRGLAPLLVIATERDRKEFVQEVAEIVELLNPTSSGGHHRAVTFEGFFLEARDEKGAFVRVSSAQRGTSMGGQWSWNRCIYPYEHAHLATIGPRCPD